MSKILAERNLKGIWVGKKVLVSLIFHPSEVMACRIYRQGFIAKWELKRTLLIWAFFLTTQKIQASCKLLEKLRPEWILLFFPLFDPKWIINPFGGGKYRAGTANNCLFVCLFVCLFQLGKLALLWQVTFWVPGSPYCLLNTVASDRIQAEAEDEMKTSSSQHQIPFHLASDNSIFDLVVNLTEKKLIFVLFFF